MITTLFIWSVLLTGACAWLGWRLLNLQKDYFQREAENVRLQKDIHGLLLCMRGVSDRFDQHQKQLRSVTVRQNDISKQNVADSHYQQAAFMMEKGATIDDLVTDCGLSRGEAEMMIRIHSMHQSDQSVVELKQAGLR